MWIPLPGFVLLISLILIIDSYLIRIYRLTHKHSLPLWIKIVHILWHYLTPIYFISSFTWFYIAIPLASSPDVYNHYGWTMIVFLLLYIPRALWAIGHLLIDILEKFTTRGQNISPQDKQKKVPYPKITRRKFMSQVGIIIATAPFISLILGGLKGRFSFFTRYKKLSFPNLPLSFEGLKIVQISDTHLGCFNSNHALLDEVVDMINDERPDLILFTGDLVNNFYQETIGWENVFGRLKASIGKYSILGNHDYGYYSRWKNVAERRHNFEQIVQAHAKLGFKLLRNENVVISNGIDSFAISGVEYWGVTKRYPNTGDLKSATHGIEDQLFKLLLTHDPNHWDAEVIGKYDYDLTLTGHTHGMQLGFEYKGFKWSPAKYKFKRWDGLYREGNQFMYVNRGLGVLGIPARVGMDPEITIIELSRGPIGTYPM